MVAKQVFIKALTKNILFVKNRHALRVKEELFNYSEKKLLYFTFTSKT